LFKIYLLETSSLKKLGKYLIAVFSSTELLDDSG